MPRLQPSSQHWGEQGICSGTLIELAHNSRAVTSVWGLLYSLDKPQMELQHTIKLELMEAWAWEAFKLWMGQFYLEVWGFSSRFFCICFKVY